MLKGKSHFQTNEMPSYLITIKNIVFIFIEENCSTAIAFIRRQTFDDNDRKIYFNSGRNSSHNNRSLLEDEDYSHLRMEEFSSR